jgi:hypothetical protein
MDHIFWLGGTTADAIIQLRSSGKCLSETRRFTRNNLLLPIPMEARRSALSKSQARQELGIPENCVMILSIGRGVKYIPSATHDFCSTIVKVLDENPNAHLYVVGASAADLGRWYPGGLKHDRLHLLGRIDEPGRYLDAADIFVESFNFGSHTALLEGCLAGLAPVRSLAPKAEVLVAEDVAISDILPSARTEEDYRRELGSLITDGERRQNLGMELAKAVERHHVGEEWRRRHLNEVYEKLEALQHSPRQAPWTSAVHSTLDDAVAEMLEVIYGRHLAVEEIGRKEAAFLPVDTAYWVREAGDHTVSFRLLWEAGRRERWPSKVIKEMLKLPVLWSLSSLVA